MNSHCFNNYIHEETFLGSNKKTPDNKYKRE